MPVIVDPSGAYLRGVQAGKLAPGGATAFGQGFLESGFLDDLGKHLALKREQEQEQHSAIIDPAPLTATGAYPPSVSLPTDDIGYNKSVGPPPQYQPLDIRPNISGGLSITGPDGQPVSIDSATANFLQRTADSQYRREMSMWQARLSVFEKERAGDKKAATGIRSNLAAIDALSHSLGLDEDDISVLTEAASEIVDHDDFARLLREYGNAMQAGQHDRARKAGLEMTAKARESRIKTIEAQIKDSLVGIDSVLSRTSSLNVDAIPIDSLRIPAQAELARVNVLRGKLVGLREMNSLMWQPEYPPTILEVDAQLFPNDPQGSFRNRILQIALKELERDLSRGTQPSQEQIYEMWFRIAQRLGWQDDPEELMQESPQQEYDSAADELKEREAQMKLDALEQQELRQSQIAEYLKSHPGNF